MKTLTLTGLLLFMLGCTTNPGERNVSEVDTISDSISIESGGKPNTSETDSAENRFDSQSTVIPGGVENLPEWGIVEFDYDKYYPGILDTIRDRRIITSNRLKMNPGNGIIVTVLNNHGTFEQMFLCTHDSSSNLMDSYYIGIATMWDDGTATSIERQILDSTTIRFETVIWGENRDNGEWDVDTVKYQATTISIASNGRILKIKETQQRP